MVAWSFGDTHPLCNRFPFSSPSVPRTVAITRSFLIMSCDQEGGSVLVWPGALIACVETCSELGYVDAKAQFSSQGKQEQARSQARYKYNRILSAENTTSHHGNSLMKCFFFFNIRTTSLIKVFKTCSWRTIRRRVTAEQASVCFRPR